MRSLRKPALLLALVAVIALAVPAVASASRLEYGGKLLPVGVNFNAVSHKVITSFGQCSEWTVQEQITKNDGTTVEGICAAAGTTRECSGSYPFYTVEPRWNSFTSTTPGKGTVSMSYEMVSVVHCRYSGAALPFTYILGSNEITFNNVKLDGGLCGTQYFSGTFALTIGGVPVILK